MLESFGLQFHHFGLAVKEPMQALKFLGGLGYTAGKPVFDPLQSVNLIMCAHTEMPDVEIIYSAAEKGPIDSLIARRPEGIVYHLCYTSRDVAGSLKSMESAGLAPRQIVPPKPAVLFDGKPVSFYMIPGIGLIEIIAV